MEQVKEKKHNKGKIALTAFIIVALIATWLVVVMYGIDLAKDYIDTAISRVELKSYDYQQQLMDENAKFNEEIDQLNEEITTLRTELSTVNEQIQLFSLEVRNLESSVDVIEQSVSNSVLIQSELGKKIEEMENRLEELNDSLNILLEAPNE